MSGYRIHIIIFFLSSLMNFIMTQNVSISNIALYKSFKNGAHFNPFNNKLDFEIQSCKLELELVFIMRDKSEMNKKYNINLSGPNCNPENFKINIKCPLPSEMKASYTLPGKLEYFHKGVIVGYNSTEQITTNCLLRKSSTYKWDFSVNVQQDNFKSYNTATSEFINQNLEFLVLNFFIYEKDVLMI